jgi:hypothetical protein
LDREPSAQVDQGDVRGIVNAGPRAVVDEAVDIAGVRACRVRAAAAFVADMLQEPFSGIDQSDRCGHPPIVARLMAYAGAARGSPS